MRYLYVDPSDPFSALRGFGVSASASSAVSLAQQALKSYALDTGNIDYDPGPVNGLYGRNTHAAILRVARDTLESLLFSTPEMRSTCNTMRSEAKSACQDYIGTMLRGMNQTIPGLALTPEQIEEVQKAYVLFLEAYIIEYGEGGELDPAQIARREDVPIDEAAVLAAERAAESDRVAEAELDTQTQVAQQTAADAAAAAGAQPRLAGWKGIAAVVAVLALGGVLVKMYLDDKKKRKGHPALPDRNAGHRYSNRRV
jgi:hypothetical protein